MNYTDFCTDFKKRFWEIAKSKGVEVEVLDDKRFGIKKVYSGKRQILPTVDLTKIYKKEIEDVSALAESYFNSLINSTIDFDVDGICNLLLDRDFILNNCYRFVVPADYDFQCDTIYRSILDLKVLYKVILSSDNNGQMVTTLPKAILDAVGITDEDLWSASERNESSTTISSIRKFLPPEMLGGLQDCDLDLEVVMNKYSSASVMLNKVAMASIYSRFGEFVILPSSVHEIIVISLSMLPLDVATQMTQEVNKTELSPNEILSNHAYLCDGKAIYYENLHYEL